MLSFVSVRPLLGRSARQIAIKVFPHLIMEELLSPEDRKTLTDAAIERLPLDPEANDLWNSKSPGHKQLAINRLKATTDLKKVIDLVYGRQGILRMPLQLPRKFPFTKSKKNSNLHATRLAYLLLISAT